MTLKSRSLPESSFRTFTTLHCWRVTSWLGQINSTLLIILVSQKKIRDLFTEQKEVKIETGMGKEVLILKQEK